MSRPFLLFDVLRMRDNLGVISGVIFSKIIARLKMTELWKLRQGLCYFRARYDFRPIDEALDIFGHNALNISRESSAANLYVPVLKLIIIELDLCKNWFINKWIIVTIANFCNK